MNRHHVAVGAGDGRQLRLEVRIGVRLRLDGVLQMRPKFQRLAVLPAPTTADLEGDPGRQERHHDGYNNLHDTRHQAPPFLRRSSSDNCSPISEIPQTAQVRCQHDPSPVKG
jgi:hypothetical protein